MDQSARAIPDAALEADIAVLGKKGRGKTYTAKGCVERLLDMGRRVIVLDPLSTWWGLKAGPNGFPIAVLGGPQGDLPLRDVDGEQLGRFLAGANQSAVLDLGAFRKAEMVRFASAFLEELYTHNRDPLWLVLEEADVFAPQNPTGDQARLYGEVDRIARRGRQFGFRLITLTQRPARLAKDVLTQLSTLVALGITSPQDRDAIKAWVEGNADRDQAKQVVGSLASLEVGEGWVWAPDLDILDRVCFPKIRTLDTSATPKVGEARPVAKVRKDVDVEALRAALASREPAADDNQAGSSRAGHRQDSEAIAAAERRGYDRGREEGFRAGRAHAAKVVREMANAIENDQKRQQPIGAPQRDPSSPAVPQHPKPVQEAASHSPADLNMAARKMLAVLDTIPPVRRSWTQVATLAGLRARGGHFNAGRKGLIDGGHVIEDGGLVTIAHASADAQAPSDDPIHLVETWSAMLPGAAAKILRDLFANGGSSRREIIAERLGMQPRGGHWNAGWKELRDNDIVRVEGDVARLTELFQPESRP